MACGGDLAMAAGRSKGAGLLLLLLLQYVPLLRRSFQMYKELERETKQVRPQLTLLVKCWSPHLSTSCCQHV